ncbi:MAG TPA: hypothetical protein VMY41_09185 [Thermohalobaculum sp.]|nr:hypothetical protein [Thermohalobaculum sp.]
MWTIIELEVVGCGEKSLLIPTVLQSLRSIDASGLELFVHLIKLFHQVTGGIAQYGIDNDDTENYDSGCKRNPIDRDGAPLVFRDET